MEELKRTLTREELHELVWSTPMQKLAESYGLSDRGLAKICERHLVPPPPRGYWAKVQAGQPVRKPKLRSVANSALHTVQIGSRPVATRSPYLAEILATAHREIEQENAIIRNTPQASTTMKPVAPRRPRASSGPIVRKEIQAFIGELRAQKVDRDGFADLKRVKVAPPAIGRVEKLLDRLGAELAPYGFIFDAGENRVGFAKDGNKVDFEINAPRKRITKISKSGWRHFDYEHAGRLTLRMFGKSNETPKNWADSDRRKIEEAVPQMVEGFRIQSVAEREWNEQRRRQAERRAHLARRREMAALRVKREEDRLEFLRWIADATREAEDLRTTIASVAGAAELPPDYQRMVAWARGRLAELEAQTSVEQIQTTLVDRQLYTDPDHLFDPEGEPAPKTNYWDD